MIQSCKLSTVFEIAEINISGKATISSPLSELLTSAAVRNLFTWVLQKPIRYVTIHFQDRSGAVSLRCKNRAKSAMPLWTEALSDMVFVSAHKLSGIV